MNATGPLSDKEWTTLTNGLATAATRFEEIAKEMRDGAPALKAREEANPEAMFVITSKAMELLAPQFEQQAADTRALLAKIEDHNDEHGS